MSTPLSLVIISNSPIMRMGLRAIFKADPEFSVFDCNSGEMDAIDSCGVHPRLFLLDVDLCDTLKDVVMRITSWYIGAKIVVLIPAEHEMLLMESIGLGVDAMIDKASHPDVIFNTVKMLCAESPSELVVISPVFWSNCVVPKILDVANAQKVSLLTRRELEILSQLDKGYSNQEIATQLFISPHTVKRHIEHVLKKFDAKDRHECVRLAHADGLLRTARRPQSSPETLTETFGPVRVQEAPRPILP